MPTGSEDLEKVKELRKKVSEQTRESGSLTAKAQTLGDTVMSRVKSARAERGVDTMAQSIGDTTGQILSAPADLRARTANVNPLDVDALTARQSGQTLGTLAAQSQIQQDRGNTIEGILGAGTNQLLAAAAQKRSEAEAAKTESDSIIEMLRLQMDQAQAARNAATQARSPIDVIQELFKQKQAGLPGINQSMESPQYSPVGGEGTRDGGFVFRNGGWQQEGTEEPQSMNMTADDFAMLAASDPDNINVYKTIYQTQLDEQERAAEQDVSTASTIDQVNSLPDSASRIQGREALIIAQNLVELQNQFNAVPEGNFRGVGPIAGRAQSLKETLGGQTEISNYLTQVKDIFNELRKESTGVVFTEKEIRELEDIFSRGTRGHAKTQDQLDNKMRKALNKVRTYGIEPLRLINVQTNDIGEVDNVDEYLQYINGGEWTPY